MEPVSTRAAVPGDEGFLFNLYASTRSGEISSWGWDESQKQAFLRLQFNAQRRHYSLAYDGAEDEIILVDSQPVGRLLVLRMASEIRLVDIAFLPEYRNKGLGTRFIRMLQQEASRLSKALRLHVSYFNPALRLYRRMGFVEVGDTGAEYFMEWMGGERGA